MTADAAEPETHDPASSMLAPSHGKAMIARAGVAAIAAMVITFSADHSPTLGLTVFGVFAVATGLVVVGTAMRTIAAGRIRSLFVLSGITGVLAGVVAVVVRDGSLETLLLIVAAWAAITGFIEIFVGLSTRGSMSVSRDWVFVGFLTALLAVTAVVVPRDLRDPVVGVNGVEAYLTSSVVFVGAIGAYCAVVAVYLAIAGLSLNWESRPTAVDAADRVT